MKYNTIILAFLMVIGIDGCGYKEGVVTSEQKSYLYFTGNVKDVSVVVDGGEKFNVEAGQNHRYKIAVGKHTIIIHRGTEMIVKREIFISDGIAKEIEVQP
jgi:hypothetical protein